MAFFEDIIIRIGAEFAPQGFNDLKKALNDERNQLNALARETQKGSVQWKEYKAQVADINRTLKLSSTEFGELIIKTKETQREQQRLEKGLQVLNNRQGQTTQSARQLSKGFGAVASGISGVVHAGLVLNPLLENQTGIVGDLYQAFDKYGVSILATSSLIRDLKPLVTSLNAGFLAGAGVMSTLAIGVGSVASAFALMGQNISYAIDLFRGGGDVWDFMTHGILNPSDKTQPQDDGFKLKVKSLDERVKEVIDKQIPTIEITSDAGRPKTGRGGNVRKTAEVIIEKTQQELYIEMLRAANEKLKYSKSARIDNRELTLLQQMNLPGDSFSTAQPQTPSEDTSRNLANDAETMYGAISSSMNALGVGTDTFVGSMITGFGTVLTIMEAIKAVNSILSIIPGFASGGIATGSFIAGERGAELITPLGGGMSRIYNNSDTNRILNQTNTLSQSPVNIYLSANVNPKYFKAQMENYNSMKQYTKV